MIRLDIKLLICFFLLFFPSFINASTQVISGGSASNIVNNQYSPLMCGGNCGTNTSVTQQEGIVSTAGTISKLRVKVNTAPGASPKTDTFALVLNGVTTALTCSITGASTTTCQDSSNSVSVVSGDRLAILTTLSNTPTATTAEYTVLFNSTNASESLIMGNGSLSTLSTSTARFAPPFALTDPSVSETVGEKLIIPASGVIKNLHIQLGTTLSSGSYAFLISLNGSTAGITLTCTVTAQTCNDTNAAHGIAVSPGDTISVKITPSSPSSATYFAIGLTFAATTDGEFIVPFKGTTLGSSTQYINSYGTAQGSENIRLSLGQSFTAKNMYVVLGTDPGGTATRTLTLRANSSNTAEAVTISSGSTTGNTTTDVTINDDDILSIGSTVTSTPATSAVSLGIKGYLLTQGGGGGGSSPSISTSRKIPFVIEDDF